ncbi:MAG TPA: 5-(carboxyamino)imidazole ribonucleotide mutase [Fimbriimonadaceae bacterium]|nr:5-(carboxyamino)imidazole ribonucleotide mutase [Fimbriimonadaceae bacterium]
MANPLVGIVMGSKSDHPTLQPAEVMLAKFGVPFETRVVSAHRTPDAMVSYAREAEGRELKVIIAAAGGAAHLPGMIASMTVLPVVGVPVQTRALSGVDSLHSIVQMPAGVPVATVGIDNGANAALLAVRILATSKPELAAKLHDYFEEMKAAVAKMNEEIGDRGSGIGDPIP